MPALPRGISRAAKRLCAPYVEAGATAERAFGDHTRRAVEFRPARGAGNFDALRTLPLTVNFLPFAVTAEAAEWIGCERGMIRPAFNRRSALRASKYGHVNIIRDVWTNGNGDTP
jgi:hypothetical protein